MLEHEILRIQSQEAIGEQAEQAPPTGLVLHLRVIKPDGSVLEPEPVGGKQTLTMPHLEVGDYVEIEHISEEAGRRREGAAGTAAPSGSSASPTRATGEASSSPSRRRTASSRSRRAGPCLRRRSGPSATSTSGAGASTSARRPRRSRIARRSASSSRACASGWGISLSDTLGRLVDLASPTRRRSTLAFASVRWRS